MNDQVFFADVALPFHFWVRERSGTRGYRWVLRKAADNDQACGNAVTNREPPTSASGGE